MQDNQRNWKSPDDNSQSDNHRIGRELYERDQQRHQSSSSQHRAEDRKWDSGNHFHTGHNSQSRSHFPEDSHQRTSNADLGGSMHKHYGDRESSSYRNNNNLNYGDGRGQNSRSNQSQSHSSHREHTNFSPYGDGRGPYNARQDSYGQGHDHVHSDNHISDQRRRDDSNENYYRGAYMDSRGVQKEKPRPEDNPYNEWPGSRSRYKDDDYRYGSGNHDWYSENRYTTSEGRRMDPDKGGVLGEIGEGAREAWHDMKNMFSGNSNKDRHDQDRRTNDRHQDYNNSSDRSRSGSHKYEYRSRDDRGVEKGPRWSDESDTGDDSFFYNHDNNPRYY